MSIYCPWQDSLHVFPETTEKRHCLYADVKMAAQKWMRIASAERRAEEVHVHRRQSDSLGRSDQGDEPEMNSLFGENENRYRITTGEQNYHLQTDSFGGYRFLALI